MNKAQKRGRECDRPQLPYLFIKLKSLTEIEIELPSISEKQVTAKTGSDLSVSKQLKNGIIFSKDYGIAAILTLAMATEQS